MSLNVSRSAAGLSRQALRRCRNRQLSPSSPVTSTASHIKPRDTTTAPSSSKAAFSTSTPRREAAAAAASGGSDREKPRWSYTPERMIAPFSPHITKNPARRHWEVNNDPKKLDAALTKFLGRDGDRLLPEELKWLAVTHKSFDQGRRGFNDRLAFLGMFSLVEPWWKCRTSLLTCECRPSNMHHGSHAVHHHLARRLRRTPERRLRRPPPALRGRRAPEPRQPHL